MTVVDITYSSTQSTLKDSYKIFNNDLSSGKYIYGAVVLVSSDNRYLNIQGKKYFSGGNGYIVSLYSKVSLVPTITMQ